MSFSFFNSSDGFFVLWFDALWQCLSVKRDESKSWASLWFDALWQCLSVRPLKHRAKWCCDLMHFDNVFQFAELAGETKKVVIWCTLTMSFSSYYDMQYHPMLWFDALWQCLSVGSVKRSATEPLWFDALWQCLSVESRNGEAENGCDLMHFDNVFQSSPCLRLRCWLWFDALWQCLSVIIGYLSGEVMLWFDALWQCLSVSRFSMRLIS